MRYGNITTKKTFLKWKALYKYNLYREEALRNGDSELASLYEDMTRKLTEPYKACLRPIWKV